METKTLMALLLIVTFIAGWRGGAAAFGPLPASAREDRHELDMRTIKALEAIAAGVCQGKPSRFCAPYQLPQGDVR